MTDRPPENVTIADAMSEEAGSGELPCRSCGYDLRGRSASDVCPECQSLVSRSLGQGDSLGSAEPSWVRGLRRGTGLTIIGVIASAMLTVGVSVGYSIAGMMGADASAGKVSLLISIVGGLATMALTLVIIAGAWLLTAPDPGRGQAESPDRLRIAARYLMLAQFLTAPVQMLWMNQGGTLATPESAVGLVIGVFLVGMIGTFSWLLFLLYLVRLYARVGPKGRSRQLRVLAWLMTGVTIVMVLVSNILMYGMATGAFPQPGITNGQPPTVVFWVLAATSGVCFFIWLSMQVWLTVVLLLIRRQLTRLTREAEQFWGAEPAA